MRGGGYDMCEGGGCGVCVPYALSQIHTCMRMYATGFQVARAAYIPYQTTCLYSFVCTPRSSRVDGQTKTRH